MTWKGPQPVAGGGERYIHGKQAVSLAEGLAQGTSIREEPLRFCSVLFCSAPCCSVLFCSVLLLVVLFCSVLFCFVLFCSLLFCSVLFHSAPCGSVQPYPHLLSPIHINASLTSPLVGNGLQHARISLHSCFRVSSESVWYRPWSRITSPGRHPLGLHSRTVR